MPVKPPDIAQEDTADSVADTQADDILSEVLKFIEKSQILNDLTKSECREYIKSLAELDRASKQLREIVCTYKSSQELLTLITYMIFHAHKIGTYKTSTPPSLEKSVVSTLLTPRTKRPTAEYVDWLEMLDPDFKCLRERKKAQTMRNAKAEHRYDREAALMTAIRTVRGDAPSAHPDTEAAKILVRVNKILSEANHAAVSKDVIYRRLKKYPRS